MSERLVAYAPNGARLGVLPWPLSWSVTIPHGELGAASLTYSRKAVGGSLLGRRLTDGLELALEVWTGTAWMEPAGGRFLALERRFDPSDATDTVHITAPAYGWLLSKIRHAAPSEAMYATDGDNKGRRQFIGVTAGVVLKTLRDEYVARGGWAIELGFTTATDSRGNPWPPLNAFWVSRGEALDVTIGRLADGGAVETWWEGRTLHAAPPAAGRELGNEVILRAGREIAEAASTETISDLISAHTLHGGDGLMVTSTEPTAPTPWGRWEGFASDDRVTVPASATARNQSILAASARMRGQYTRDLTPLASALLGVDVLPGDWIAATTAERAPERVRVASLLWRSDVQGVTRSLILNDSLLDAELRRQRRARLGDDVGANGAGTTVRPVPEGADKRTPAKVAGLVATSDAYIDPDGSAQALLSASWAEVSTARPEDGGGALEVAGYDLAVRRNVVGAPWTTVRSTEALSAEYGPLPVGEPYQVRVRARGRYATAPGLWSDPVTLTMAVDTTPPPVPSAPIVSARLGVVQVEWNGLAAGGGSGVPVDYARTEVAVGTTTTPTTVKGQILRAGGMAHINGLPYSTQHWVRLRSVDRSGNASAWSAATPVTVTPLVDADLIGTTIEQKFSDANDAIDDITDNVIPDLANDVTVADGRFTGSTAAPTLANGSGKPVNALWSQYDGERLVGTWLWTGTAWVPRDPAKVHIDSGTFGDLDGIRLKAKSVLTDALAVGISDNAIVDPWFMDSDIRAARIAASTPSLGMTYSANGDRYYPRTSGLSSLPADGFMELVPDAGRTQLIPVQADTQWVLSVDVWADSGISWTPQVLTRNTAGSLGFINLSSSQTGTGGWVRFDFTVTIPDGIVAAYPRFRVNLGSTGFFRAGRYLRFSPKVGTTLIEPGAVTSDKATFDQSWANETAAMIANFDQAFVNKFQADFIEAGSYRGQVIEGADIKSNNPGDPNNNIRLHDRTLTVNRDDGEGGQVTTTQLGGPVSDQLILRNTAGATRAMLDAATGTGSVSEQFSVGSLRHNGDLLTDLLARLPQGVLAYHRSAGDSSMAGSDELGYITSGTIPIRTDRMYRFVIDGIIAAQTAGDRARVWIMTWDATNGIVRHQMGQKVIPTTTGDTIHVETTVRGWIDGDASVRVSLQNATANRGVFFSGRANYPTTFVVEDAGPADLAQVGSWWSFGTPLSSGTPTNETGAQTYTRTYDAAWTRSWRGGSTVSDFLHHGQWGGVQRYSMVGFGGTLAADLSGATIVKAEVLLDNQHWYYGAGGTLRVGSATNTSAPASPVTSGTVATTAQGYGQQIWAAVGGFTTASRAITLGVGAGSSLEYYGKQSNSGVKLRVTYRK